MDLSQYYKFTSSNGVSVMMRRGSDAPKITSGGGRWRLVERPRRTSSVQWDGNDPYRMDVSVLFDGWADNDSIELEISKLNQMQMADKAADLVPPPTIRIEGGLPVKGALWVIERIVWGENVIWKTSGDRAERYRQDAVVSLLQYIAPVKLNFKKPSSATTTHKVKSGETLKTVAKKNGVKVKDIQKVNNIRDPKTVKTGDTIKVPKKPTPSMGVNRAEGTTVR